MGKGNVKESESDTATLNQGQGPEFQRENPQGKNRRNEGNDYERGEGEETGINEPVANQPVAENESDNPNGDNINRRKEKDRTNTNNEESQDLPSKEREGVPYVGDNPEETREEAPTL